MLELAVESARDAAALLLERFRAPARRVSTKSTATDLVSDADRDAESLILQLITQHRPDDGIVAEEGGTAESASGLHWVVDPLDGTVNFLFGIPHWAVSVAVEDAQGALVGVIYDPNRDELFAAVRGQGCELNGVAVSVSSKTELAQALIATGFAYEPRVRSVQAGILPRVLPAVRDIRRAGAAALDFAWTASGRVDGYYEATMGHWDRAAGELLVTEAGGRVTAMSAPYGAPRGVIASGPGLHDALVDLVIQS